MKPVQINKSLVEYYFNKLFIVVHKEGDKLSYELPPYFYSKKDEMSRKIHQKKYDGYNFKPTYECYYGIHYFLEDFYCYLDNIELVLAYTKCYYHMCGSYDFLKYCSILKYILTPDNWDVLMYINNNIMPLKSKNISISSIYEKFGSEFAKQVIDNGILINYDYAFFTGLLVKKQDYDMFYFVMGEIIDTPYANTLNSSDMFIGVTSFMHACRNGDMEIIKYLLNNTNVDINKWASSSETSKDLFVFDKCEEPTCKYIHDAALICACAGGHLEVVKLLLDLGAYTDILYKEKYNIATISLVGCNKDLIDFLVNEFDLSIQLDFIKCISKYGTPEALEFAYNNFNVGRSGEYVFNLFNNALKCNNIPVMEFLLTKINGNILRNLSLTYFTNCCLTQSECIQTIALDSNPEFLQNAESLESPKVARNVKNYLGVKCNRFENRYDTILYNFLISQEPKRVIVLNLNEHFKNIQNIMADALIAFKVNEDYYVCYNWSLSRSDRIQYYKVNAKTSSRQWITNFNRII